MGNNKASLYESGYRVEQIDHFGAGLFNHSFRNIDKEIDMFKKDNPDRWAHQNLDRKYGTDREIGFKLRDVGTTPPHWEDYEIISLMVHMLMNVTENEIESLCEENVNVEVKPAGNCLLVTFYRYGQYMKFLLVKKAQ